MKGRKLRVPRAAMGVARFFFHDLCEQPLAAADYLRIAHEFHTLIIDRIPVMGFDQRNAAKRFIILIDTLYDHAVKLVASAEAEPDALYRASDGFEARRVQPHRVAADRDALAVLSRAAARPAQFRRQRIERRDRGDVRLRLFRLQPGGLDQRRPFPGLVGDERHESAARSSAASRGRTSQASPAVPAP